MRDEMPKTKEEIEALLDQVIAGTKNLFNPDYETLKYRVGKMAENAFDVAQQTYLDAFRETGRDTSDHGALSALYYNTPYPHAVPGFAKKIDKIKVSPRYEFVLDAFKRAVALVGPVCAKLVQVKPLVKKGRKPVEIQQGEVVDRAALEAEKSELQGKLYGRYTYGELSGFRSRIMKINALLKASDAMEFGKSPLFRAVLPLKEAAMAYARAEEIKHIAAVKAKLAKNDWNLETVAPRAVLQPKPAYSQDNRIERERVREENQTAQKAADSRRGMFLECTAVDLERSPDGMQSDVVYLKASDEREQAHIEFVVRAAGQAFDEFVTKLDHKIGQHDTAQIEGRPWTGSIVTITKGGLTERWKTKQIINRSVYNKLFNQWPTTRLGN